MNIEDLKREVSSAAVSAGIDLVDDETLPARNGNLRPIPTHIDLSLYRTLQEQYPDGLYVKIVYSGMQPWSFGMNPAQPPAPDAGTEWLEVFAIGETVLYINGGQLQNMFVRGYRYTPAGLMYELSAGGT